ncbi:TPA: hypothetical protein ACH3X3_001307 [Trebouxia sp. C0006]
MAAYRSTYRYGRPDILAEITPLLDAVGNPGQFACGFSDPSAVLPGLAVAGFGTGRQCPQFFTAGPCTAQLQQSRLARLRNRLTDKVATELGVSAEIPVQAQLNKMTLYQTGDHFVAHRNTEKAPGMFATMTIVLPSQHTGGSLVVQNANWQGWCISAVCSRQCALPALWSILCRL